MRASLAVVAMLAALPAAAQTYEGSYVCGQGVTKLTLTAQQKHGDTSMVLFAFGPSPMNPSIPDGSFIVSGTLNDTTMQLMPLNWVKEVYGYQMVGLVGSSKDGKTYTGQIMAALGGCSSFSVTKK